MLFYLNILLEFSSLFYSTVVRQRNDLEHRSSGNPGVTEPDDQRPPDHRRSREQEGEQGSSLPRGLQGNHALRGSYHNDDITQAFGNEIECNHIACAMF